MFQWLETKFLKFFDDWDDQVNAHGDNLKADEKAKLKLSKQTLVGLRITSKKNLFFKSKSYQIF